MVGFEGIDRDIWPVVDKAPKAVARAEITPGRCAVKQEDKLLDWSEFPEIALAYEKEGWQCQKGRRHRGHSWWRWARGVTRSKRT